MIEADCYPEHDSPWTLYFNGAPMPRWANSWGLLPVLERADEFMRDWDEFVGFPELWRLHCRIDHVGIVESEDPEIFRLCCLTLAFLMLRDEAAILGEVAAIAASGHDYGGTPAEIFAGVRDGLFAMHQRSSADDIAFWTSGYDADRDFLCDSIRRHRLPSHDPDWLEAPHDRHNRAENQSRISFLHRDLLALTDTHPIPKEIQSLIYALSKGA